ncbi:MurT ligase domain-containing protein [Caldicellulosiruptoraceae bacterium PP1]
MRLKMYFAIFVGKVISFILRRILKKSASSIPGMIAYRICPELLEELNNRCKIKIIISGTNGKTTTNNLINNILREKYDVISNLKGSNMAGGLISSFLNYTKKSYDVGCFEVDEGSLPRIRKYIKPDFFITTNIFRDQLDRYGELDKVKDLILSSIPKDCKAIINADDPNLACFSQAKYIYFYTVSENNLSKTTNLSLDSRFCPICNTQLIYYFYNIGHLGKYRCSNCGFENPKQSFEITNIKYQDNRFVFDFEDKINRTTIQDLSFNMNGLYNLYNVAAAISVTKLLGIDDDIIKNKIESFNNRLGRMEELNYKGKKVIISLVKNPIGITETLKIITYDNSLKNILFILNDNGADGKDVSWIWDADFDILSEAKNIKKLFFSGKRKEDMQLRVYYSDTKCKNFNLIDYREQIENVLEDDVETVYILPTYTALFDLKNVVDSYIKKNS